MSVTLTVKSFFRKKCFSRNLLQDGQWMRSFWTCWAGELEFKLFMTLSFESSQENSLVGKQRGIA